MVFTLFTLDDFIDYSSFAYLISFFRRHEKSRSGFHWERPLRNISERDDFFVTSLRRLNYISKKMSLLWHLYKTSQKHLKKDVFCVTFSKLFEHISKKTSIPWRLWDILKISLASICDISKIPYKNGFVWFP